MGWHPALTPSPRSAAVARWPRLFVTTSVAVLTPSALGRKVISMSHEVTGTPPSSVQDNVCGPPDITKSTACGPVSDTLIESPAVDVRVKAWPMTPVTTTCPKSWLAGVIVIAARPPTPSATPANATLRYRIRIIVLPPPPCGSARDLRRWRWRQPAWYHQVPSS